MPSLRDERCSVRPTLSSTRLVWDSAPVVRTGKRVAVLREALEDAGVALTSEAPPAPRLSDLADSIAAGIVDLYRQLGGVEDDPHLRPGPWDLSLDDGLVIEL